MQGKNTRGEHSARYIVRKLLKAAGLRRCHYFPRLLEKSFTQACLEAAAYAGGQHKIIQTVQEVSRLY